MQDGKVDYPNCSLNFEKRRDPIATDDAMIRKALILRLRGQSRDNTQYRIVEELGLNHGSIRADVAVINGALDGFEIKSDKDNLSRLPGQIRAYNSIFDTVTIVVGMSHVYKALEIIPDWWGVTVAKVSGPESDSVSFSTIRIARYNEDRDCISLARLLWREEALKILNELHRSSGLKSKPRKMIYEALSTCLDMEALSAKVRLALCSRKNWRVA